MKLQLQLRSPAESCSGASLVSLNIRLTVQTHLTDVSGLPVGQQVIGRTSHVVRYLVLTKEDPKCVRRNARQQSHAAPHRTVPNRSIQKEVGKQDVRSSEDIVSEPSPDTSRRIDSLSSDQDEWNRGWTSFNVCLSAATHTLICWFDPRILQPLVGVSSSVAEEKSWLGSQQVLK